MEKGYVFYDDSWVGIEPYNDRFYEFGFDRIIKCVFSGYKRLCAGVDTEVHELRLHPYLSGGAWRSSYILQRRKSYKGCNAVLRNVRRALLREPIQRIGLGGYLHLTENYPDFCDYIEKVADEFRMLKSFSRKRKALDLENQSSGFTLLGQIAFMDFVWTFS